MQLHTNEHIERLTVRLKRIAETQQQHGEALQRLTAAQLHTKERPNALIFVVDALVRRPPRP